MTDMQELWPYNFASRVWGRSEDLLWASPMALEVLFSQGTLLDGKEAGAVTLVYREEMSPGDAAEALGLDPGEVLASLREAEFKLASPRGRAALRTRIPKDVNRIEVSHTELSNRTINALRMNGISTLSDACKLSRQEMKRLKGMGAKSLEELEEFLATMGMALREEMPR